MRGSHSIPELVRDHLESSSLYTTDRRVYSAYEYSSLQTSTLSPNHSFSLPTDIVVEVLTSLVVLCLGIVLSAPALRPVQWSKWAKQVEMEHGRRRKGIEAKRVEDQVGAGMGLVFKSLDERMGFLDIRVGRAGRFLVEKASLLIEDAGQEERVCRLGQERAALTGERPMPREEGKGRKHFQWRSVLTIRNRNHEYTWCCGLRSPVEYPA